MGFFELSFGKKRRSTKRNMSKRSKKTKAGKKPPSRLLKICKKYHVKATKKVGSKRLQENKCSQESMPSQSNNASQEAY